MKVRRAAKGKNKQSPPLAVDPLTDHVLWAAGKELAQKLYLEFENRIAFENVSSHFLAESIVYSLPPDPRERRAQRLLAATVRTIAAEDTRQGPVSLARYVVRIVEEIGRRLTTRKRNPLGDLSKPLCRQRIARSQLRLRRPLPPTDRQTLRRFDRVGQAIVEREDLRCALLHLLPPASAKPARDLLKRNLTALFRHCAELHQPSLELSIKDIILLAEKKLSGVEVKQRLLTYRKQHGFTLPNPPRKPGKAYDRKGKESFDVIDRRVRAELRDRYGEQFDLGTSTT